MPRLRLLLTKGEPSLPGVEDLCSSGSLTFLVVERLVPGLGGALG